MLQTGCLACSWISQLASTDEATQDSAALLPFAPSGLYFTVVTDLKNIFCIEMDPLELSTTAT